MKGGSLAPGPSAASRQRVHEVLARCQASPPQASADEVAELHTRLGAPERRHLVLSLVRMVQDLVTEVETGRELLLDAQCALTSVLRRVERQNQNCATVQASAEAMERAVDELACSNTQLRYQQLLKRRPRSAGRVQPTASQRAALELGTDDWALRESRAAAGGLCLVGQEGSAERSRAQAVAGLVVAGAGAAAARPRSAPTTTTLLTALESDPRGRVRLSEWQQPPPQPQPPPPPPAQPEASPQATVLQQGSVACTPYAPPPPSSSSQHRAPSVLLRTPETGTGPAAPSPHARAVVVAPSAASPPSPSPAREGPTASMAQAGLGGELTAASCARPWSQRAEQLHALRPAASEAAASAATATAAAAVYAQLAHRYHLADSPESEEPAHLGGYGASPSHASMPAWRTSHRRPLARAFSAGSVRTLNAPQAASPPLKAAARQPRRASGTAPHHGSAFGRQGHRAAGFVAGPHPFTKPTLSAGDARANAVPNSTSATSGGEQGGAPASRATKSALVLSAYGADHLAT